MPGKEQPRSFAAGSNFRLHCWGGEPGEPAPTLALLKRLERAIERERLRDINRHWSYDLNHHIALKRCEIG